MNGFPATGAMHFGKSGIADRKRVPRPPASMIASLFIYLFCFLITEIFFFYQLTDYMANSDMRFLDTRSVFGWHIDEVIAQRGHFTSGITGETDGNNAFLTGNLKRFQYVGRIA